MANEGTVEYNKFNVKNLSFTKLEENSRSKGQMIAYPRYDLYFFKALGLRFILMEYQD